MKNNNEEKGFTLIELIVVVAILAIISAAAVPNFMGIARKADTSAQVAAAAEYANAINIHNTLESDLPMKDSAETDLSVKDSAKPVESVKSIAEKEKLAIVIEKPDPEPAAIDATGFIVQLDLSDISSVNQKLGALAPTTEFIDMELVKRVLSRITIDENTNLASVTDKE